SIRYSPFFITSLQAAGALRRPSSPDRTHPRGSANDNTNQRDPFPSIAAGVPRAANDQKEVEFSGCARKDLELRSGRDQESSALVVGKLRRSHRCLPEAVGSPHMSDDIVQPAELVNSAGKTVPNSLDRVDHPPSLNPDPSSHTTNYTDPPLSKVDALGETAEDSPGTTSAVSAPEASEPRPQVPRSPSTEVIQPAVPSRSSSKSKILAASLPQGESTLDRQEAQSRPESQSGIRSIERNGSIASRRSRQGEKATTAGTVGQPTIPATSSAKPVVNKRRGKGFSRFLGYLNCCSAPENANSVGGEDQLVPPRKVAKLQPSQGRQPIPVQKPDASAAESSTGESKEMADEKIGGPPYSDIKAAEQPKMQERPKEFLPIGKPSDITSQDASDGNSEERVVIQQANSSNEPEPLPSSPNASVSEERVDEPRQATTQPAVQPPVMAVPVGALTQAMQVQDATIDDRTPEQVRRESDVEMVDAPPEEPLSDEPMKDAESGVPETVQSLPPPPPLISQSNQVVPSSGTNRNSTNSAGVANEKQAWLLPPIRPEFQGKKCLVLDLDETLVHSSFKILHQADFTIPVEIEGQYHNVYVIKRPGVDQFMKRVGELYEVVVFTASVSKYGDPLLDQLDIHHVVHHRLFRESCYNHQGNYVKDLSQVGRDLRETIIIDNSPTSYIFHPQHAVPISSWFSDAHDNELLDLIPVLEDLAGSQVRDVSLVLDVAL
ncbi:MAG: hypothetical protein Q9187_007035, partial [Circinaria calcarea]